MASTTFSEGFKAKRSSTLRQVPSIWIWFSAFDYGSGTHILYCGNLGLIQLVPLMVDAMDLLRDKDIYFHIIGMGPMTDYLINQIRERRLDDRIIYHGPIVAKLAAAYFKNADALYVSLRNKGTVGKTIPNKLMMSMAFARPIVGVIQGDGRDVLKESGGVFLADENAESVKNALLAISNLSANEKARLGRLNKLYYDSHFSTKTVAALIEKEFR